MRWGVIDAWWSFRRNLRDMTLLPALFISLLSVLVYAFLFRGFRSVLFRSNWEEARQRKVYNRTLIVVICWAALLSVLALTGFFNDFTHLPPRLPFVLLLPLPFVLIIAFSPVGTELLRHTPPHWLVYLQSFRILVECLLWISFLRGLVPVQMSFEGRNFDVLSGLLAIPVGYYCLVKKSWPRSLVVVYNIIGLGLLVNIMVIAVLSLPTPFRYFHNGPANTVVTTFPFIFLPGMLVPLAYAMHIFSLRQVVGRDGGSQI